jgi:hypothetical protein
MPRSCTICEHPEREAIDRALVGDSSNLSVSSLFGVSESAVRRHKANHLPAKLVMAQAAEEVAQADDLLAQMQDLQRRTLAILEAAETTKQHRTALSAIREARGNLELLAKLLGELDERPQVNVLISPTVQTAIIAALEPHPEARLAVASALKGLEDGAA